MLFRSPVARHPRQRPGAAKAREARHQGTQHHLDLGPCERRAEAEVHAGAEAEVPVRPARDVEAMRRGAKDFITKPWDNPRLVTIVKTQIELASAVRAYLRLEQENQLLRGKGGPTLIAQSAAMRGSSGPSRCRL